MNPIGVYAEIFTAAMLPGVGIAIAAVASPFLYILMWPTLIVPCLRSDRVLKQTPMNQRTHIIAILWIAWITGVVSGYLGLLSII